MAPLEQFIRLLDKYPLGNKENLEIRRTLALTTRFAAEDILHLDGQKLYSYCFDCGLFIIGELPFRDVKKLTRSILQRSGVEYYCPICETYVFERHYSPEN